MNSLASAAAGQADRASPRRSPFQGLAPYGVADADYFFARDAMCQTIVDYLCAYRISVLYGASGVGKSSVLSAGVMHELLGASRASLERDGALDALPVIFSMWSGDPVAGLGLAIRDSVRVLAPELSEDVPTGSLAEVISAWGDGLGSTLLIMLDQFEEYFVYHRSQEGPAGFASQLAEAAGRHDVPAHFLIAIREDAIAKLDRFQPAIPELWTNLLRMDHLDHSAAREAIEGPIKRWSKDLGTTVEWQDGVVAAVLDQAETRSVRVDKAGLGGLDDGERDAEQRVEAPYLQLVMMRLWDEEARQGSNVLRTETLARMGGADEIIRGHFDQVMRELPRRRRIVAARMFEYLVTPAGTKIALPPAVIARWSDQEETRVASVLAELASGEHRILRTAEAPGDPDGGTAYEIYHDRLGAGILDWRTRFVRRRALRRRGGVALLLLLALVGISAVVIKRQATRYDSLQNQLRQQDRVFKRNQVLVGAEAKKSGNFAALAPLSSKGLHTAFFSPDGRSIITASEDGTAIVSRSDTGRKIRTIQAGAPVVRAIFSPDSHFIGVETNASWGGVWDARRRLLRTTASSNYDSLAFTPDGKRVLTARDDGTARFRDVRSGRTLAVLHGAGDGTLDTAVLNPQGTLLATAAGRKVVIWDLRLRRPLRSIQAPRAPVAVTFDPRNADFVTVSPHHVLLWGPGPKPLPLAGAPSQVGQPVAAPRSHLELTTLFGLADFSPDGQTVVVAGDRDAHIFDLRGHTVATLRGHVGAVNAVRFSPSGRLVATASDDNTARLWDARSGRSLAVLAAHRGRVTWVDFRGDSRRVVTASADGTAIVWNVPRPLPDLTVRAIPLRSAGGLALVGVLVTNTGTATAPRSTVRVAGPEGPAARAVVGALKPGATRDVVLVVRRRSRANVLVAVDPGDRIKELDEHNNSASASIPSRSTLPPPPRAPRPSPVK